MYDEFSADYDRFVNWPARLAVEMPFIEAQLQSVGARRVLDAACGTGMHAIELAKRGYESMGADVSAPMIERARANARAAGVATPFLVAGFGELLEKTGGQFDALLCLGNSLPHLLTPAELHTALQDFAACLRSGGLLLIQNRNFDAVLAYQERWMAPQAHREGDTEWLFLRFYDFQPQRIQDCSGRTAKSGPKAVDLAVHGEHFGSTESDGRLTFNLVTLRRQGGGDWEQRLSATPLWPQRQEELSAALAAAGFGDITCYGHMSGTPFDAQSSSNLVATARKEG
ncbi:MAG: class I SAM-dependent methyltransferase [Anaerolineae bacterium]|nr:class I SAM-dependent methyltransferase [Anaerolineae bacterium]